MDSCKSTMPDSVAQLVDIIIEQRMNIRKLKAEVRSLKIELNKCLLDAAEVELENKAK